MTHRFIRLSAGLAAALAVSPALAQNAANYPSHPISLFVAFPAGGPPDLVARIIAPAIGEALGGASVVVENRAGAGGIVGISDVARATPDGYTLLLADLSSVVDPFVFKNPGYDPKTSFEWIAPVGRSYMTMLVNPASPARTVADFVAMAKAKPGDLKFGASGVGSPPWLGGLAFMQATGTDLLLVPYRGIALAVNDLIADRISTAWMSYAPAAGQLKAGVLRVIGVFGKERLPQLPDVPTFREVGLDMGAADEGNWLGIAAPKGTPPDVLAKLNAAVNKALHDPATHERLTAADYEHTEGGTPAELKAMVDESVVYWGGLFAKAGVKPE